MSSRAATGDMLGRLTIFVACAAVGVAGQWLSGHARMPSLLGFALAWLLGYAGWCKAFSEPEREEAQCTPS